jgi:hypothetical protein
MDRGLLIKSKFDYVLLFDFEFVLYTILLYYYYYIILLYYIIILYYYQLLYYVVVYVVRRRCSVVFSLMRIIRLSFNENKSDKWILRIIAYIPWVITYGNITSRNAVHIYIYIYIYICYECI